MKKWVGILAIAVAANSVSATILYDPFSTYTTGASLIGQAAPVNPVTAPDSNLWNAAGTNASSGIPIKTTVLNTSLSYPGLADSQGGSLDYGTSSTSKNDSGLSARVDIGGFNGGNVYYSMVFQVNDLTGVTGTNSAFVAAFTNSPGAQSNTPGVVGSALYLREDPTNSSEYDLGISAQAGAPAVFSSGLTLGTSYFIVSEFSFGTSPAATSQLWIDPGAATFGTDSQPSATETGTGNGPGGFSNGYKISSFVFRQSANVPGNTNGAPNNMIADELRIGTSYAGVTAVEWNAATDGSWSAGNDWTSGVAPGGQGSDVTFGTNSTGYNVNLDSNQTVGTIRFNGNNGYTIGGTSTLTLDTAINGDANIQGDNQSTKNWAYVGNAENPAQIVVSGAASQTISAPVYLNRSTSLSVSPGATLTLSGGVSANTTPVSTANGIPGVWLSLSGGGNAVIVPGSTTALAGLTGLSVQAGNLKFAAAHSTIVLNTGTATIAGGDTNQYPNTITNVNIAAGATLDLTNNDLIINRNPGDGGIETAVLNDVERGYNHGAWNGTSSTGGVILSSAAASKAGTALAYVDNAFMATPLTTVDAQAVTGNSIIVKYTWYGDLNLDGVVDNTDLGMMTAQNGTVASGNPNYPGWAGGDLNYDGQVNGDDWSLYQLGAAESGGASINSVPEPGAVMGLSAVTFLIAKRRRAKSR